MRRGWIALVAVLVVVGMGCAGLLGPVFVSFPTHQGSRVEGSGVVGIDADGAYAWVVPTRTGVVLVDVGLDPDAERLLEEVRGRAVHAILITHGHLDHIAGIAAFPEVPVYVGPSEAALVTGERSAEGQMQALFGGLMGEGPPPPAALREVEHGEVLRIDGHDFGAIHLPGHTHGSTAWLWRRVLFSGDSLFGHADHVAPAHRWFAEDYDANVASIERLTHHGFDTLADGHAGLHVGVAEQVRQFVDEHRATEAP